MDTSASPPYGSVIELARKRARLSIQEAATKAGISKQTWMDVVKGRTGTPKPETIARMAHAAQVSPQRLESEGKHPRAAEILQEILTRAPAVPPPSADETFPEPEGDAAWILFPRDRTKRWFWRLDKPEAERAQMIRELDEKRREVLERPQRGDGATGT